ncbi:IS66 family insertion sequence element accessory protein TnpB [Collimonas humicola]|uniref:IS66 family insertion sequence element accessory protein TnpB n=1 Tax=Collimonas humicola TaxID=2825886 RepID=UPI001B8C6F04
MMGLPAGTRIWIEAGVTDMRAGFNGLAGKVQTALADDPFSGHVFLGDADKNLDYLEVVHVFIRRPHSSG